MYRISTGISQPLFIKDSKSQNASQRMSLICKNFYIKHSSQRVPPVQLKVNSHKMFHYLLIHLIQGKDICRSKLQEIP